MLYVWLAALLFGFVYPGSKLILDQNIDVVSFCLCTSAIRVLAQLPIAIFYKKYRVLPQAWPYLLGLGAVGVALQLSEFRGIKAGLPVALVSFLVYTHPLWSLLLSSVINKEPFRPEYLFRLGLGLLGLVFILGLRGFAPAQWLTLWAPILAGFLIALWISISTVTKSRGVSAWSISFYFDIFVGVALLILRLASPQPGDLLPWSWLAHGPHLALISGYAVFIGLLPNLLFYHGSAKTGARAAGLILLLEPVVASIIACKVWNEQLAPYFVWGAALILLSAIPWSLRDIFAHLARKYAGAGPKLTVL